MDAPPPRSEPRLYPDPPPPDRGAIVVRAICGVLLGAGVAVVVWLRSGRLGPVATAILMVVSVAVCVHGAVRGGDAFWMRMLRRRD